MELVGHVAALVYQPELADVIHHRTKGIAAFVEKVVRALDEVRDVGVLAVVGENMPL